MGANGSTPEGGSAHGSGGQNGTARAGKTIPEDLYELLNVEPHATPEEIRKAFRREALKWHPDKNAGSEEASRRFVQIQSAYDVLSDDQERAYYDAHRGDLGDDDLESDSDLRAKAAWASATKQSIRISSKQLTRFFDPNLWSGDFSDSSNSFFSIYRTLFDTISQSEYYATAPAGEPALSSPPVWYPSFGDSRVKYDVAESTAKKFYAAYLNFASRRPFNEVDKYRLQGAPDRRVKRLMEKENKRARDDARREYNEAVRSLAAFLKRRDPRFLSSDSSDPLRAKAVEKQRQQSQLRDAAVQAAKKRQENAKAYQEQEWQRVRVEESSEEDDDDEEDGSEVEDGEGKDEGADSDVVSEEEDEQEDNEPVEDWFCPACEKDFNSQGAWDNHERSKKHLKNLEKLKKRMQDEEDEFGLSNEAEEKLFVAEEEVPLSKDTADDDAAGPQGKRKLSKKEKKRMQQLAETFGQPPLSEMAPEEPEQLEDMDKPEKEQPSTLAKPKPDPSASAEDGTAETSLSPGDKAEGEPAEPQMSKKDKRRAREAAKKTASGTNAPGEICNVCQTHFTSRTKLFSHISDTGHAAAVAVDESDFEERKGKGGKRKGGRR